MRLKLGHSQTILPSSKADAPQLLLFLKTGTQHRLYRPDDVVNRPVWCPDAEAQSKEDVHPHDRPSAKFVVAGSMAPVATFSSSRAAMRVVDRSASVLIERSVQV